MTSGVGEIGIIIGISKNFPPKLEKRENNEIYSSIRKLAKKTSEPKPERIHN